MADWFSQNGYTDATAGGGISAHQAETINRLMAQGVPLNEIAAAVGLPASLIQGQTGYGMNGPANQGGAEVEPATPEAPAAATSGATDPLGFIAEWQRTHPATRDSFLELANELQTRFGIQRAAGGVGPSNNEFMINGEKVKVMSAEDSANPSWFAYGADDGWRPGGTGTGSLAEYSTANAPSYTYQPYQQPDPFSYKPYQPGTPFQAPKPEDVLNDPGVKAALDAGQRALEQSASARGTLLTGRTAVDVGSEMQNRALGFYDDAFNRSLSGWGANESQRINDYTTDRNNAYQNYALNLGAGQDAYRMNADQSLNAFNANLGSQGQFWNQSRLQALDQYGEGQDYINNLFRYAGANQGYTGVTAPYTGRYLSGSY